MTTAIDNPTDRRIKVLDQILSIVMAPHKPSTIILEKTREASFVDESFAPGVGKRFIIEWDSYLNFKIFECGRGGIRHLHLIPTSRWYRVGALLQKQHLDAEALKRSN